MGVLHPQHTVLLTSRARFQHASFVFFPLFFVIEMKNAKHNTLHSPTSPSQLKPKNVYKPTSTVVAHLSAKHFSEPIPSPNQTHQSILSNFSKGRQKAYCWLDVACSIDLSVRMVMNLVCVVFCQKPFVLGIRNDFGINSPRKSKG